jgi:hypothetical protein
MPERRKRCAVPGKVDARELIARLSQQSQRLLERELIAPLLRGGRIRTRLDGLVYEFRVPERFQGWGRFRPSNEHEASLIQEALPWERGAYLELFPLLRMLLLWPDISGTPPGTWLALPYNESDARQRFDLPMGPLPVYLCDPLAGAERFERVIVRVDGRTLWFDGPDLLADPQHAEWLRTATSQDAHRTSSEPLLPGLASSQRQAFLLWSIHQLEGQLPSTIKTYPICVVSSVNGWETNNDSTIFKKHCATRLLKPMPRFIAIAKCLPPMAPSASLPSNGVSMDTFIGIVPCLIHSLPSYPAASACVARTTNLI